MTSREERNNFSMMIEERAERANVRHMEVIIDYCEETGLEIEVAATLINSSLKSKIENEARDLRFLPKGSKLPI
jgi:hypothetical protein